MELTGSGEPTVEELRRLLAMQGEREQSHGVGGPLEAPLGPSMFRADDHETGAQEGDELRPSLPAYLKTAAAGRRGAWHAARQPDRAAAMSERARAEAREP